MFSHHTRNRTNCQRLRQLEQVKNLQSLLQFGFRLSLEQLREFFSIFLDFNTRDAGYFQQLSLSYLSLAHLSHPFLNLV